MLSEQPDKASPEKGTGRIEAFSDGVFAVAITLLGVNLVFTLPPTGTTHSSAGLASYLLGLWPTYLAVVTSFATILIMWIGHHQLFKLIYKADPSFMFANGFLLLLVTALPFPTSLVADYLRMPAATTATAVYAGLLALINGSFILLWWVATRRHLIWPQAPAALVQRIGRRTVAGFPPYVVAVLAALWLPLVSIGICLALSIYWITTAQLE